jgi:O-antigen ligase
MMAIPGITLLVIFIYARPQEFFERLRMVPFLYVFFALALFGGVLDFRLGNVRLRSTPQLPWVALLFVWGAFTVLIRAPSGALTPISGLAIGMTLYLLIGHGVQTFRGLHVIAGVVLAMVILVCGVGAQQGFAEMGCVVVDQSSRSETTAGTPDGRPCDTIRACYQGDAEPGAEYACEHIGLLGTTSVGGGRVRYRGVLQDPNELSLAGGIGLPLAFALGSAQKRTKARTALALLTFALVLFCAVLTGSRGGQLVFLTVLGAYFFRRFGVKGLLLGAVLSAPLLLLGGSNGEEASSSTLERLDCWAASLSIWRSHPLLGVGLGQFGEYNYMTAHNSYLLALAELGLPGMLLFSIIVYLSAKIPFTVLREVNPPESAKERDGEVSIELAGAAIARPWAMALLAAFAGLAVGIFFLSFTYHYVLWIYIGLSAALYSAVRAHYPPFRVRFGLRDLALVVTADIAVVAFVYVYTRQVLG